MPPKADVTAGGLRAESDTFVAQLERLGELEDRKRDIPPSDPRFLALSVEVEEAARALLADAEGQTRLGDDAHVAGIDLPIASIDPNLSAAQLMVGWRNEERKLASFDAGSDEARASRLMIDAYRRAYQALFKKKEPS